MAVPLAGANPVAVVLIGSKGELSIGAWEGRFPATTESMSDVAAVEAAIVKRAKAGSDVAQRAAEKWTENFAPMREYRDQVGERLETAHDTLPRTYFGQFPSGLDPKRTEELALPTWGQTGRLRIARADVVDRVPPLAPLIASAPNAPALPAVRIATTIGGAIGVSLDGAPGVLRTGFRWAIDIEAPYDDDKTWVEIRAAASGLDVIDLRAKEVRAVGWDKLATLVGALGTPPPEMVDILVASDLTTQQLVDTLVALRSVRWTNLVEAPAVPASERLAQLRAARLAHRVERRVSVISVNVTPSEFLESDAYGKVLWAGQPALGSCYDARRPKLREREGKVDVSFALSPGGKVSGLRVVHADAQLASCMRNVIAKLTFPSATSRKQVSCELELTDPELHQ